MAITRVNSSAQTDSSHQAWIASAPTSLTAGNLIVVTFEWYRFGAGDITITQVDDTAGNTYVSGTMRNMHEGVDPFRMQTFYCQNALGHASNIVAATLSASTNFRNCVTVQYAGTTGQSLGESYNAGSGTSPVLSAISTTDPGVLVLSVANYDGLEPSTTPPPTVVNWSSSVAIADYVHGSALSNFSAGFTLASSTPWGVSRIAFADADVAVVPPPETMMLVWTLG